MVEKAIPDTPTHAELAAQIPPAPDDEVNDAIVFARKTLWITLGLAIGFIGAAVVWTFVLQT
jgi:hypothetical protein